MIARMTNIEPLPLEQAKVDALLAVSTGTLTTVLLKKGLRNVWMRGTMPLKPGQPRVAHPHGAGPSSAAPS